MNLLWMYTRASITRNGYRTLAMVLGTMLAIGLLSAVLFYVDASASQMTQKALAAVPVDLQVVANSTDANLAAVEPALASQPGITGASRFSLAGFTSGQISGDSSRATATTPGALLAVETNYFSVFSRPRVIEGQFSADGLLISKDMATNLGARPGDTITLRLAGLVAPYTAKVSGIVDLSGADVLFAPTDPLRRALAFNPPTNVVIMNLSTFDQSLRAPLLATAPAADASAVVSQAQPPVSEQIHLRIDHAALPGDPIQAQTDTEQMRRLLERQFPGQIRIINNLTDAIEGVKGDILWAKILVVFLAGPGILLAAYLSRYSTLRLIAAQRRELALLRARGATPNQVVALLTATSAAIAVIGVALGLLVGGLTSSLISGATLIQRGNTPLLLSSALVSLGIGLLIALVATVIPARSLYLGELRSERRQLMLETKHPLWQRLYLDLLCLVVGIVILVITQQNGFAPVLNGEGNATLSLSLLTFLSPTLIWLGAALLLTRVSARLLRGGQSITSRVLHRLFGNAGRFAAQGMTRRSAPLQQIVLIIALALAFGTSVSGFSATYRQQQRVDAELTLGADVKVTPDKTTPQTVAFADSLRTIPGIVAVSPFDQTVAYVGSELQDLFGVNVFSLRQAATLSDSFFLSGTADAVLSQLTATPDGIIVSEETAKDYSIVPGDHLNIRLTKPDGSFVTAKFQLVGVAREFPTAPKDSFLVVNQDFLHQQIGSDTVSTFLIRTDGDPVQVAAAIQNQLGINAKLKVETINSVAAQLASTLTTVSLDGLTKIEWAYTLLIAGLALAIFLLGLLAEREAEYATLAAIGATPRQVQAFMLSEAFLAGTSGIVFGGVIGLALSEVLVTILGAIFDPPPTTVLIPLEGIGVLFGLAIVSLMVSSLAVTQRLRWLQPAYILRNG